MYLHDSARLEMPLGSSPLMLGAGMKLLSEMLPKMEKRGLMCWRYGMQTDALNKQQ